MEMNGRRHIPVVRLAMFVAALVLVLGWQSTAARGYYGMPVLDTSDDAFFAPLENLEPNGARVYLGAIHHMDSFDARIAVARRYCPDFGLAAYCGFGRMAPSEIPDVLADHLQAIRTSA